jgi:hypothetical protein
MERRIPKNHLASSSWPVRGLEGAGILAVGLLLVLSGCDMFAPRTPEEPTRAAGTWLQPDTPDRVVQNMQKAIEELNVQNYRRSLDAAVIFRPAATVAATSTVFAGWDRSDEERYFSTLVAASDPTAGHNLRLVDAGSPTPLGPSVFVLDATYVLTVNHGRSDVPNVFQGRLVWTIEQDTDGLWRIVEWRDQEIEASPSWSTLKAEFG